MDAFKAMDERFGGLFEPRRYALLSKQGTACSETVLLEDEFTPEMRSEVERRCCLGQPDDPLPGTWTDVTDNEACRGDNDAR